MSIPNPFSAIYSLIFGGGVAPVPPVEPQPPSAPTIITPGNGILTDADGNVWSISLTQSVIRNNKRVPGGGGTQRATLVNGVVWAEDAVTDVWYAYEDKHWDRQYGSPPGVYS